MAPSCEYRAPRWTRCSARRATGRVRRLLADSDCLRNGGGDQRIIRYWGEVHEPDVGMRRGHLECESCLADPTGSGQCHQPRSVQEPLDSGFLVLATNETA